MLRRELELDAELAELVMKCGLSAGVSGRHRQAGRTDKMRERRDGPEGVHRPYWRKPAGQENRDSQSCAFSTPTEDEKDVMFGYSVRDGPERIEVVVP